MKLACSTLLFGGHDLDTALDGIAEAGYEAIELVSIPNMGLHFEPGMDDDYYRQIREKVAERGLVIESVGVGGAFRKPGFEPLVAAAAKLGAPYITTSSGGTSDDEDEWEKLMYRIKFAKVCARSHRVKISFKPHVGSSVYSIDSAKRFMEECDSEWLGLNIDGTHLQRIGDDPVEAVEALKPWIFTARIRDYKSDDMSIGPVENQIPGKGILDVKAYYNALARIEGLDWVTVEMVGSKDFTADEVQRVIEETYDKLRDYQLAAHLPDGEKKNGE
ncbi:MAG: sugar phosphate isomerase/epimerase family protein [Armatimonadota bacterium]